MEEIIEIEGRQYRVLGDYPDGKYQMFLIPVIDNPPPVVNVISKKEFLERIPRAKRVEIFVVARSNAIVSDFMNMLSMFDTFNDTDGWFVDGLNELVTVGVITQEQLDSFLT